MVYYGTIIGILLCCLTCLYGYNSQGSLEALNVFLQHEFPRNKVGTVFCKFQTHAATKLLKQDLQSKMSLRVGGRNSTLKLYSSDDMIFVCGNQLERFLKSAHFMGKNNLAFVYVEDNMAEAVSMIRQFKPKLDQQILLMNMDTMCLSEYYFIKSSELINKLICDSDIHPIVSFIARGTITTRRSDFNGTIFKLVTAEEGSTIQFNTELNSPERETIDFQSGRLGKISTEELTGAKWLAILCSI